jgi:proline iminopeptidase
MDPAYMKMMSERLPDGSFHLSPNGSHLAIFDDQQTYMTGLVDFIHDVDTNH